MKKTLFALIALISAMVLCACGANQTPADSTQNVGSNSEDTSITTVGGAQAPSTSSVSTDSDSTSVSTDNKTDSTEGTQKNEDTDFDFLPSDTNTQGTLTPDSSGSNEESKAPAVSDTEKNEVTTPITNKPIEMPFVPAN